MKLPELTATQSWCCGKGGCGVCKPVPAKHEFYRHEDLAGKLIESHSEDVFVSNCCRGELLLWDEAKQDFIDWTATAVA